MKSLLGQPFLQFLVLGGLVFCAYAFMGGGQGDGRTEVVVDEAFVRSIREAWKAKRLREPTQQELRSEVANRVELEMLYLEGVSRGLDQGDLIVKRRVAQKMDFLVDELAGVENISEKELRAHYQKNQGDFLKPKSVSFRQLYFAAARQGVPAPEAARAAHEAVHAKGEAFEAVRGDNTTLPLKMADASQADLERSFGKDFAAGVGSVTAPGLVPPLESSFGWHVVNVVKVTSSAVRPFDEVKARVRGVLETERRAAARKRFFAELTQRYPVRDEVGVLATPGGSPP